MFEIKRAMKSCILIIHMVDAIWNRVRMREAWSLHEPIYDVLRLYRDLREIIGLEKRHQDTVFRSTLDFGLIVYSILYTTYNILYGVLYTYVYNMVLYSIQYMVEYSGI